MTFGSDDDNDDDEPSKRRRINAMTAKQPSWRQKISAPMAPFLEHHWGVYFGSLFSRIRREDVCSESQERRMRKELGEDQVQIIEVFSPSRVNRVAAETGLTPGDSFDLQTVDPDDGMLWDFNKESKRRKAFEIIKTDIPKLIIGSPFCTAFLILQNSNKGKIDEEQRKEKMKEAIRYLRFVCEVYKWQSKNGRFFYMSIR